MDCNILVQLAMGDHALHDRTLHRCEEERAAGHSLQLVPLAAAEFLHVVTDPRS